MAPPFPRAGPGVPPVAIALRFGAGPAQAAPTRRSVRCFGEMAPPFPRVSPGVPPVAIALRFGAGPAKAAPTRRSVRRIFPAARVAGKNDSDSFRRWRRKPGRGNPFLDFSPRDGGRESPVGCLLLLEESAIRLAAKRHCRRKSRRGGRTRVPGRLLASVRRISDPARRLAALPAKGPLRRGGRRSPVGCLLLLEESAIRLATKRHCRRGIWRKFCRF